MFEGRQVLDVTRSILSGMTVWPGDPGVTLDRTATIGKGTVANVTRINMGDHSWTHMDAPLHLLTEERYCIN